MNDKLILGCLLIIGTTMFGCKNGCMECTGMSAPKEICEDDYIEKSDYQAAISAYEATGGECNEK